ncbi:hypothetical protein U0070_014840 [Myodes glareolus]|uniref:PDEase domain-containing protein n=1 Tax=Myodes glareolus TaxID=447135 RepID=A0AAW0JEJ2_MYOGA
MVKLRRFLVMIQEDYHSQNPYHNAVHAADVTQAMHCYLKEPKYIMDHSLQYTVDYSLQYTVHHSVQYTMHHSVQYTMHHGLANSVTPWDILLSLIAAATHDLDHPGVNQPFLIKTNHYLATLYKRTLFLEYLSLGKPPLEIGSGLVERIWFVLTFAIGEQVREKINRKYCLLYHFSNSRQQMETQIGALILATDISRQNEYLSLFRSHLDRGDLHLDDGRHRHLVLQMALKCADICNPCRNWELSKQWSEKVTEEFFHQGRTSTGSVQRKAAAAAELRYLRRFMTYLVEPLFTEWARFSDTRLSQTMLGHVGLNKASWKGLQRQQPGSEDANAAFQLNSQLLTQENRLS